MRWDQVTSLYEEGKRKARNPKDQEENERHFKAAKTIIIVDRYHCLVEQAPKYEDRLPYLPPEAEVGGKNLELFVSLWAIWLALLPAPIAKPKKNFDWLLKGVGTALAACALCLLVIASAGLLTKPVIEAFAVAFVIFAPTLSACYFLVDKVKKSA